MSVITSISVPFTYLLTLYFVTSWQSAKDVESAVNSRIADYQAYIEEIAEFYEESGQHINADQDIHTVFECIESIIVNPIPRKNWQGVSLIWFERRHFAREDVHSNLSVTLSSYFKRCIISRVCFFSLFSVINDVWTDLCIKYPSSCNKLFLFFRINSLSFW